MQDVANDLGMCISSISNFETGKNKNLSILLWYVERGLDLGIIYGKEKSKEEIFRELMETVYKS